ncbi:MAG: hypothetical protein V4560_07905 [Bacteroidota bacterium]
MEYNTENIDFIVSLPGAIQIILTKGDLIYWDNKKEDVLTKVLDEHSIKYSADKKPAKGSVITIK